MNLTKNMDAPKVENKPATEPKPQKSQKLILQHTEEIALTQLERKGLGLTLSGISAGLDIGFSVLLITVVITSFGGYFSPPVIEFLVANMYPIGFVFVILGRSELFTEHTTLAILPVLQGLASIKKLLRLWVIVYLSNILGGIIFALILWFFSNNLNFIKGTSLTFITHELLKHDLLTLLLSATLAGWMMGLLTWLIAAARDTISQIVIIWIVTASIGFAGLPHCIVGNIEVLTNLFRGEVSFGQYFYFLGPVTLGNAIGGLLFVGVVKFSHTALSGEEKDLEEETEENSS